LSVEGFRTVKQAGIGTYQVFQETYDQQLYNKFHLSGKKADYNFRLTAFDRAMEAGIDDVGLGALLGLGDPFFELMAMVRHVNHLEACYGVGAHTLSFPRIKAASGVDNSMFSEVSDEEFIRFIAILRLAVPYTGMILTARESSDLRREALAMGISQIDGGTKIEIGGYSSMESQNLNREQFLINDERSLQGVIRELTRTEYIPSFCTACYRKGRTGEHFMEFSVPGFIKRFCTPNAILSYAEYLEDYADKDLRVSGYQLIDKKLNEMLPVQREELRLELEQIKKGKRDLHH
ncbi:MAG: [FeFe] hydrogenase H-cluster radical SAM maturase HydG, partial [Rikenellaceae bacterium]